MLRKFYLIILLMCIEWTYSYNHIDDAMGKKLDMFGRYGKKTRKLGHNRIKKNLLHQKYSYDRSPVDFDVASFIQADDEIEDDASISHLDKKRHRPSNNYDYNSLVDININEENKRKKDKDNAQLILDPNNAQEGNLNNLLYKDDIHVKHDVALSSLEELNERYNSQMKDKNTERSLTLKDSVHAPVKKCVFKSVKIPFFSRKKPKAATSKKPNKRKVFCFNCPNKNTSPSTKLNRPNDDLLTITKKSHYKKIHPETEIDVKFSDNLRYVRRKKNSNGVHDIGRRFIPKAYPRGKNKELLLKKNSFARSYRNKRDDTEIIKQLKELEEVEKRIDQVHVTIPNFSKPAAS